MQLEVSEETGKLLEPWSSYYFYYFPLIYVMKVMVMVTWTTSTYMNKNSVQILG